MKRLIRKSWPALLATTAVCMALPAHGMTLEQAVAQAIDSNPRLLRQYTRYESVRSERQEVRSAYYPQASVRAGYGKEKTDYNSGIEFDEKLNRQDLTFHVSQLLFNGFRTQANSSRLSHEAESERQQLMAEMERIALDVCETYNDIREGETLYTLTQANVADHEKTLTDIREQLMGGFASEGDVAQVSSRLGLARASLDAAENNLADKRSRFRQLVGVYPDTLADPAFDASLLPKSKEAALKRASEIHPELLAAQEDIAAAAQERRANRAGYWPTFNIEYDLNHSRDVGGFEGKDEDSRIMLTMNYDIFNGGRDRARSAASGWRQSQADAVMEDTRRQVVEGTELSWNALASLQRQKEALSQSVDAASATEAAYIIQFKLGKRSLLDLLNAKSEVFLARKNYIAADYDYRQSAYRLLNATGDLSYALRVDAPTQFQPEE